MHLLLYFLIFITILKFILIQFPVAHFYFKQIESIFNKNLKKDLDAFTQTKPYLYKIIFYINRYSTDLRAINDIMVSEFNPTLSTDDNVYFLNFEKETTRSFLIETGLKQDEIAVELLEINAFINAVKKKYWYIPFKTIGKVEIQYEKQVLTIISPNSPF